MSSELLHFGCDARLPIGTASELRVLIWDAHFHYPREMLGQDWSDAENDLIVADYFAMLTNDITGLSRIQRSPWKKSIGYRIVASVAVACTSDIRRCYSLKPLNMPLPSREVAKSLKSIFPSDRLFSTDHVCDATSRNVFPGWSERSRQISWCSEPLIVI